MKKIKQFFIGGSLLFFANVAFAWHWQDLWQTSDQQGASLLQKGQAQMAAKKFKNKDWQAVASYRSANYEKAWQYFSRKKTSDGQYNAGNAAAFMERYPDAIAAYDKAIALNPNNQDAITNRDIVKKIMQEKKPPQNSSQNDKNKQSADKKNKSSAQQKQSQQNNDNKEKNGSQNAKDNPQNAKNNSQNVKNNPQNAKNNAGQQEASANSSPVNAKDEDKKQLLRRVSDDPGGLLRQKFLRDYFRRHSDNEETGENAL